MSSYSFQSNVICSNFHHGFENLFSILNPEALRVISISFPLNNINKETFRPIRISFFILGLHKSKEKHLFVTDLLAHD